MFTVELFVFFASQLSQHITKNSIPWSLSTNIFRKAHVTDARNANRAKHSRTCATRSWLECPKPSESMHNMYMHYDPSSFLFSNIKRSIFKQKNSLTLWLDEVNKERIKQNVIKVTRQFPTVIFIGFLFNLVEIDKNMKKIILVTRCLVIFSIL